jgi:hypothetical protein
MRDFMRLATDAQFENVSGGYFSVKGAVPLTPVAPGNDANARKALWAATRKALQAYGLE